MQHAAVAVADIAPLPHRLSDSEARTASHTATIASHTATIASHTATIASHTATITSHTATIASHTVTIVSHTASHSSNVASHTAIITSRPATTVQSYLCASLSVVTALYSGNSHDLLLPSATARVELNSAYPNTNPSDLLFSGS